MWNISIFLLLCFSSLVYTQEMPEASGDIDTSTTLIIEPNPDGASSGDGADIIEESRKELNGTELTGDILSENMDELSNRESDNSTDSSIFNNGELSVDESVNTTAAGTTTSSSTTVTSTETTTAIPRTTTISEEVTTSTTPSTTSTSSVAEITTTPATTTTTTESSSTSVTPSPSTTTTTAESVSSTSSSTSTSTKIPSTTSPVSSLPNVISTPDAKTEEPCEFLEDDLYCDAEISCFGDGFVDCEDFDEDVSETVEPKALHVPQATTKNNEYLESSTFESVEYFPPQYVGRVPPLKEHKFLWKLKNITTSFVPDVSHSPIENINSTPENAKTTVSSIPSTFNTQADKITELTEMPTTSPATEPVTVATDSVVSLTETKMDDVSKELTSILSKEVSTIMEDTTIYENVTVDTKEKIEENDATTEAAKESALEETTTVLLERDVTSSTILSINKRKKRENNMLSDAGGSSPLSSAESLQFSMEGEKINVKSCKIIGNMYCTPRPTTAFCRGKGKCQVIPPEKSEKSTSAKGVENWAIAVIAICATAAALTISLLVYLVVTSWKKLKVQPHNGVTTLTYVNNTPP